MASASSESVPVDEINEATSYSHVACVWKLYRNHEACLAFIIFVKSV
jgi:hypothetical protein